MDRDRTMKPCWIRLTRIPLDVAAAAHEKQQPKGGKTKRMTHECPICKKTYQDRSGYQCNHCDKRFGTTSARKSHVSIIHEKCRPYKCGHCDKAYSILFQKTRYELTHGEKKFHCEYCDKSFHQRQELTHHFASHTSEKPYDCKSCSAVFTTPTQAAYHLKTFHTIKRQKLKCTKCEATFTFESSRQKHERVIHDAIGFKCSHGNNICQSKAALDLHERVHTGEKPYGCPCCTKSFGNKYYLQRHVLRRHTGEKPFKCEQCGKGFKTSFELGSHKRLHTGERPFKCSLCEKLKCSLHVNFQQATTREKSFA